MKFKGQGKINICGFEYKKKIADSRRGGGGSEHPKKPCIRGLGANNRLEGYSVKYTLDWLLSTNKMSTLDIALIYVNCLRSELS